MPETLIAGDPVLRALATRGGSFAAELALIRDWADVVMLLLVDDPRATGALTEAGQFLTRSALRPKFAVLEPRAFTQLASRPNVPYTFECLDLLRLGDQRYSYEGAELDDVTGMCAYLERFCDWIRYIKRYDP